MIRGMAVSQACLHRSGSTLPVSYDFLGRAVVRNRAFNQGRVKSTAALSAGGKRSGLRKSRVTEFGPGCG